MAFLSEYSSSSSMNMVSRLHLTKMLSNKVVETADEEVEFRKPFLNAKKFEKAHRKPMIVEAPFEYAVKIESAQVEIRQSSNPNFANAKAEQPVKDKPKEVTKPESILVVQRTRSFRRRFISAKNTLYKLPKTVEKRNARERTRVHTVNQAFMLLKYRIPAIKSNTKRVSKLKILRAALNYMYNLTDLVEKTPPIVTQTRSVPDLTVRPSNSNEFIAYPQPTIIPKQVVDLANNNNVPFATILPYVNYESQLYYPSYPIVNNLIHTNFI